MNTKSELMPLPEHLEEVPTIRNFDVVARIKKTSKYYEQGGGRFFKLEYFTPIHGMGTSLCRDGYCLHFNGNAYRIEDCELYLMDPKDNKKFVRII